MNIERLHAIAVAILNDINNTHADTNLQQIIKALNSQINQPQEPQFQQQVSQHLQTLYTSLSSAPSNEFSPAWKQTLQELDVYDILGTRLAVRIQQICERNQITPSVALEELQKIHSQLTKAKNALDQIVSAFHDLNISAEELELGQCEIGILVPRLAVNNRLKEFGKDLEELDNLFGTFSEVTTGSRPGFEIRSISSSDLSVFLSTAPVVCAAIVLAVDRILGLYQRVLEIRKHHGELKKLGLQSKDLKGVIDSANSIMKDGIEQLTPELLEKYFTNKDQSRRNELENDIRFALNKIAKRIDKGYGVEIRVTPISDVEQEGGESGLSPEDIKHVKEILSISKKMEFLKLEGEPILTLPEYEEKQKDAQE